eukprot:scaffold383257_cov17-Prasinocladus_malaysianus.AAC.1
MALLCVLKLRSASYRVLIRYLGQYSASHSHSAMLKCGIHSTSKTSFRECTGKRNIRYNEYYRLTAAAQPDVCRDKAMEAGAIAWNRQSRLQCKRDSGGLLAAMDHIWSPLESAGDQRVHLASQWMLEAVHKNANYIRPCKSESIYAALIRPILPVIQSLKRLVTLGRPAKKVSRKSLIVKERKAANYVE